jgi:hypothetical protein
MAGTAVRAARDIAVNDFNLTDGNTERNQQKRNIRNTGGLVAYELRMNK